MSDTTTTDPVDQVASKLPESLGRLLTMAAYDRDLQRVEEAKRQARLADESWANLAEVAFADLGADLAPFARVQRPSWFGNASTRYEVWVYLPGLAPMVATYQRNLLGRGGYGPWKRVDPVWRVEGSKHTAVCPDLPSALLEAYDLRPGQWTRRASDDEPDDYSDHSHELPDEDIGF